MAGGKISPIREEEARGRVISNPLASQSYIFFNAEYAEYGAEGRRVWGAKC